MLNKWVSLAEKVNQIGPDGGKTLLHDELPNVGRVIVEKKIRNEEPKEYFGVTIIIYDQLITTSYFHTWQDAQEHIDTVKLLIQTIHLERN